MPAEPYLLDTNAFITGMEVHYPRPAFEAAWELVDEAMRWGRVIVLRQVHDELVAYSDKAGAWIAERKSMCVDPPAEVQRRAGELEATHGSSMADHRADPFLVAYAELRGGTVVTYEGVTLTGDPAPRSNRKLPAVCRSLDVGCCILGVALGGLGS